MPPGRVIAPPPGQTKRILELDEPSPDRFSRQKATMAAATDHQESPLGMDFESSVEMRDEVPPMDEETTLCMAESDNVCLRLTRGAPSIDRNAVRSEETIKYACKDILQKNSKNMCHKIKKKYFDIVATNKVSTKSPVRDLTDGEWQALVEMWSNPRHKLEMEKRKDAPVPEGEEPKSDAEIVELVLKTEVKQSTFLRNVGLKSSSYNSGKGTADVAAHVRDLEQKLERSELQVEVMQEEIAAIKMKTEEYEVARDKELELLRKKSQAHEEKLAHLMALFGAKAS
ncbi:hypothetical protein D1007_07016 [Hordeum vulgare]|nr:hypothetical protein D1007_07016 [Hordeum vulgare]